MGAISDRRAWLSSGPMTTLSDLFAQAEADFAAGNYAEALRGYLAVIQAAPRFTRAR